VNEGDWRHRAACAGEDPSLFFPRKGQPTAPARAICARCPVAAQCAAFADTLEVTGVWGGLTDKSRRAQRVAQWREQYGESVRNGRQLGHRRDRDDIIAHLSAEGVPVKTIAEQLKVNPRTVARARARIREAAAA
jgi:WhiB family transcriptional regulator, redox-sensing transcriptional regulator